MSLLLKILHRLRCNWSGNKERDEAPGIPTVKFDPSRVTESIEAQVRNSILALPEIDPSNVKQVCDAAIRSISAGRDLASLCSSIMNLNIDGMTKRRAAKIALIINNRATSLMEKERQTSLGITHAIWLYSGAPCMVNPKHPTESELRQDKAHRAANGKEFEIANGMYLNGNWTWPGMDPGCKCASRPKVPGIS